MELTNMEYLGTDEKVYVILDDGCLHIWKSLEDYKDMNIGPDEIISPGLIYWPPPT